MYRELQEAHMGSGKSLTAFEQGSDLIKSCASEKNPPGNVMEDSTGEETSLEVGAPARGLLWALGHEERLS